MSRLVDWVDPFIGIDGMGNTLCGPYLPFSLVRLGPDTIPPQSTNGYRSNQPILHFSHTHVSGTGGGSRYGNIGVIPFSGTPRLSAGCFERENETAEPGYYAVTLLPGGVRCELTVTPRVGVHRYTFPAGAQANLLIDVGAVIQAEGMIPGDRTEDGTGCSTGGFVEFITEREIVGRGDFRGGWGHTFPYSIYFYARFDPPTRERRVGNSLGWMPKTHADGPGCKAVASIGETSVVTLRVGISHTSIAHARASVDREVAGKSFDTIRTEASSTWEKALSRIRVEGGTDEQRKLFYTQFTRLLCMPSDLGIDDEFPMWHSGVRHFTDFYTIWDSVRNANSLITLIDPDLERDFLNCLLDIADHTGWIPDVWIAGHAGMIQGGCSPDVLFCEAALKGIEGIDYRHALDAMRKNNEVISPNPYLYGRYLEDYQSLGYLSTRVRKNCVSRHLEYAYQDWCIGRLAEHLGQTEIAWRYFESSRKVWNLWREDMRCFAPRHPHGEWVQPFDQDSCWADSWNDPYFYEGTSRQWSFSVQHDFAGLVEQHGGPEAFVNHLDTFFAEGHYHSKETMLHVPFLYHYAGQPGHSSQRARECLQRYFHPTRDGLSDNEDFGCQSAFLIFTSMGLYPIMGQDLYLLTAPVFERVEMDLGCNGKSLVIEAPCADSSKSFIASATLDGLPLERAFLFHHEISQGARLHYKLSRDITNWGCGLPPPSPLNRNLP